MKSLIRGIIERSEVSALVTPTEAATEQRAKGFSVQHHSSTIAPWNPTFWDAKGAAMSTTETCPLDGSFGFVVVGGHALLGKCAINNYDFWDVYLININ